MVYMHVLSTYLPQSLHQRLLRAAAERYWDTDDPPQHDPDSDGRASRCCLNDLLEAALEQRWTELGRPTASFVATGARRRHRRRHRLPRVKFTTTISDRHRDMLTAVAGVRDEPFVQVVEEALKSFLAHGTGNQRIALESLLSELIPIVGDAATSPTLLLRQICGQ